jgi:hypothetical protein
MNIVEFRDVALCSQEDMEKYNNSIFRTKNLCRGKNDL